MFIFDYIAKKLGVPELKEKVESQKKELLLLSEAIFVERESRESLLAEFGELKEKHNSLVKLIEDINNKIPEKEENEIEKQDDDFIPVTDDFRIPILDGLKVQFEGEKKVLPVTIKK